MRRLTMVIIGALLYAAPLSAQTLIWADEFDGSGNTNAYGLDLNKWEPQIGDGCDINLCGWGNGELQYYQEDQAVVSGGVLTITAHEERVRGSKYTSARIRTMNLGDWTYGRFEARIKLPQAEGMWPAFWMLPTDEVYGGWPKSGEIDIMESRGQSPEAYTSAIHFGADWPDNRWVGAAALDRSTKDDWHVFAIEWEENEIRHYVDGKLYSVKTPADLRGHHWPFDQNFHILLNVAVGGTLGGTVNDSQLPSTMQVDYVRVYDMGSGLTDKFAFDTKTRVRDIIFEDYESNRNITMTYSDGPYEVVDNPDPSGVNTSSKVVRFVRDSVKYGVVVFDDNGLIPDASKYVDGTYLFSLDVYMPSVREGVEFAVGLEDKSIASNSDYPDGRHSSYKYPHEIDGEIVANQWHTLKFRFEGIPDAATGDNLVDQIVWSIDHPWHSTDTYYFDNFEMHRIDDGSNAAPTASFTYTATDLTVDFDGSGSSDSDGTISSWDWDFGDGSTGSGELVSHTYGASGDYTVTLTVTDNDGATGTDSQVVSVSDGSGATTMHVQSIVTGTQNAGQGNKHGTATVTIHDDQENPVSEATVTGTFSGTFNETVSGQTGSDGTVTLVTSGTAKGNVTVEFCVDDVTHASLTYDANQNDITCTSASKAAAGSDSFDKVVEFALHANYPNPFNPSTMIAYQLPASEFVTLEVFNMAGQRVATLVNRQQSPGRYRVPFDASGLSSGIYLYKLRAGSFIETRKMILLK
ncbi:MAG: family 16 glycosylhydrolase [Balneolaceae bacterium]|nr:family 16 glycosylhydrolase [Balneolaceae bacterium]